jgi:hypothetical protein
MFTSALAILAALSLFMGCEDEVLGDTGVQPVADTGGLEHGPMDPDMFARTATYYIANTLNAANEYTGCSSAVRVTATGTGITKIVLTDAGFTFDTLTSGGTTRLYDTWYNQGTTRWDKDWTSTSTGYGMVGTIKVVVTGTTITGLSFWFTDSMGCVD